MAFHCGTYYICPIGENVGEFFLFPNKKTFASVFFNLFLIKYPIHLSMKYEFFKKILIKIASDVKSQWFSAIIQCKRNYCFHWISSSWKALNELLLYPSFKSRNPLNGNPFSEVIISPFLDFQFETFHELFIHLMEPRNIWYCNTAIVYMRKLKHSVPRKRILLPIFVAVREECAWV